MSTETDITELRNHMRKQRQGLSADEHRLASVFALNNILQHPLFLQAQHIALFLPNDSEIDISALMPVAWEKGKQCYLPALAASGKQLVFAPIDENSVLELNRYGIPEPEVSPDEIRQPYALDLVLTPLVAFDKQGNRIGMGGGYYDRSFAFLRQQDSPSPHLLGVAYDFQRVDKITPEEWDVPLHGVITDQMFYSAEK